MKLSKKDIALSVGIGAAVGLSLALIGATEADGATIAPAPQQTRSFAHTPPSDYRPAPTYPSAIGSTPVPKPTNTLRPPVRPTSYPTYTRQATVEIAPAPKSCK